MSNDASEGVKRADELQASRDRVRTLRRENDLLRRLLVECLGMRITPRLAASIREALSGATSNVGTNENVSTKGATQ